MKPNVTEQREESFPLRDTWQLDTRRVGRRVLVYRRVDSTNNRAALSGQAGTQGLEKWASAANVPALVRLLESDPGGFEGEDMRKRAINTLVRLKDPRGATAVARALKEPFERDWSRGSLIAMGPVAEAAAIASLDDPDWNVKVEACRALAKIGSRQRALPALERTLQAAQGYPFANFVADAARAAINDVKARP